ncbi:MAG: 4Fe-4S binding protein, partial [Fibrobacterales bacterium]|nr:4Fe-4S binding protein [Fibrobacterales bacterium]
MAPDAAKSVSGIPEALRCTGCGACAALCPRGAVAMEESAGGFPVP